MPRTGRPGPSSSNGRGRAGPVMVVTRPSRGSGRRSRRASARCGRASGRASRSSSRRRRSARPARPRRAPGRSPPAAGARPASASRARRPSSGRGRRWSSTSAPAARRSGPPRAPSGGCAATSSPSSVTRSGRPATAPASSRMVVPELPQSTARVPRRAGRRSTIAGRLSSVMLDAQRAEAVDRRAHVAAGGADHDRRRTAGQRADDQRPMRDRLVGRHATAGPAAEPRARPSTSRGADVTARTRPPRSARPSAPPACAVAAPIGTRAGGRRRPCVSSSGVIGPVVPLAARSSSARSRAHVVAVVVGVAAPLHLEGERGALLDELRQPRVDVVDPAPDLLDAPGRRRLWRRRWPAHRPTGGTRGGAGRP